MSEPATASIAAIAKVAIEHGKLMVFGATVAISAAAFLFVPSLRALVGRDWVVTVWVALVAGGTLFLAALVEVGVRALSGHLVAQRTQKTTSGLEVTARAPQSYWTWSAQPPRCELHLQVNAFNRGTQTLHVVEARIVSPRIKPDSYSGRVHFVTNPTTNRSSPDAPVLAHSTRSVTAHFDLKRCIGAAGQPLAIKVGLRTQDGVEHVGPLRLRWVDPPKAPAPGEYGYTAPT
jgi:hypothetical protein